MLTLFFRGALLYIAMIAVMRLLGKRQLGEFQPYELAMTILLADVISGPMESVSKPLLHGLLPVMAMCAVHGAISLVLLKSDRARSILSGRPTRVISRGVVDREALDRLCLSLSDLMEGLRGAGFMDPGEVGTAIVEANGGISAFPTAQNRPPRTAELGLSPGYEGMPLMLVLDGRLQRGNLSLTGRDEKWLAEVLARHALAAPGLCYALLNTQGRMTVQLKNGEQRAFSALGPEEVNW